MKGLLSASKAKSCKRRTAGKPGNLLLRTSQRFLLTRCTHFLYETAVAGSLARPDECCSYEMENGNPRSWACLWCHGYEQLTSWMTITAGLSEAMGQSFIQPTEEKPGDR